MLAIYSWSIIGKRQELLTAISNDSTTKILSASLLHEVDKIQDGGGQIFGRLHKKKVMMFSYNEQRDKSPD